MTEPPAKLLGWTSSWSTAGNGRILGDGRTIDSQTDPRLPFENATVMIFTAGNVLVSI